MKNLKKVMFINMPIREHALPNVPPLGIALLSARLRESNTALPSVLDLNSYRVKDKIACKRKLENGRFLNDKEANDLIIKHIVKYGEPNIIALSGMITTLRWQEKVAKMLKGIIPNAFLISGGGLATEIGIPLFNWVPELDAIIIGEGDNTILKISDNENLKKNSPFCIGEIGNKPRFVYKGDSPNNLDSLPLPAWDLLEESVDGFKVFDSYLSNAVWGGSASNSSVAPFTMERSITTISSRGCPFDCKFCYRGSQGQRNYRWRSAQSLSEETKWLIEKYNVDFIGFTDDNFIVDKKRLNELAILFKSIGVRWGTHGRLDSAGDLERMKKIKEAGCIYIGFGGESACPEVLKNMGKGGFILSKGNVKINGCEFPKTMVDGIKNVKMLGIHGNCTWIMGYPEETLEQLKKTVSFIKWQEELYTKGLKQGTLEYDIAKNSVNKNMFVATAYPGTEMFKHPIVRNKLTENFGIQFNAKTEEPIYDENLRKYVVELEDATKILTGPSGQLLNFSAMSDEIFSQTKKMVEANQIFKILDF